MAFKRAPGGGRKSKGPFTGKSVTITTRVTPRTRVELEREADRKGRSLSQEIEIRLDDTLRKSSETPAHVKALAQLVTLLARNVELATGRRWCDDAWTGSALRQGIDILLGHFAPAHVGQPALPPKIRKAAAQVQPRLREIIYHTPKSFGQHEGGTVITMIETAPSREDRVPRIVRDEEGNILTYSAISDQWGYGQIRRDIGSGWQRNPKIWDKEVK